MCTNVRVCECANVLMGHIAYGQCAHGCIACAKCARGRITCVQCAWVHVGECAHCRTAWVNQVSRFVLTCVSATERMMQNVSEVNASTHSKLEKHRKNTQIMHGTIVGLRRGHWDQVLPRLVGFVSVQGIFNARSL
jgi:hypothetical protein